LGIPQFGRGKLSEEVGTVKKVAIWLVCAWAAMAASAGAALIEIGSQGRVVGYPFRGNSGVDAVRCQDLVLGSELRPTKSNPVIIIRRWEWFASSTIAPGYFNHFTIKLSLTDRTALTTDFAYNYSRFGPQTVYSRSSQYLNPSANDWFGFDLTGFYYTEPLNLIVEVEWSGDTGGYTYTYRSAAPARCVFNYNGGTPVVHNYVHYMRITIYFIPGVEPTALGRVKALYS
jgi:hypothetical protein